MSYREMLIAEGYLRLYCKIRSMVKNKHRGRKSTKT